MGFGRKSVYRKGIAFFNQGRYEQALEKFSEITSTQPVSYSLHHYLARFYSSLACVNLGVLKLYTGELPQAIDFLERAVMSSPKQYAPFYYLGIAYNNMGQFDKAMESFNKVAQINPSLLHVKAKIALVFYNEARYNEAEALLEKIVGEHPHWPDMSYHLGLVKAAMGRGEEALNELDRAVTTNPNYLKARIGRGILLARQGMGEEASKVLEEVARERPHFADVHFHLGVVKAYLGHLEEAEACFKKAIEINAMYNGPRFYLGLVLAAQGKCEEAVKKVREVLLLDPNHSEAKLIMAHLERLGREPSVDARKEFFQRFADKARLEFPRHLEIYPDFSDIVNVFSPKENRSLYLSLIRLMESTSEVHPNFADVHENLGILYSKMDQHEKAITYFSKALDLNPKYIRARMNRYRSLMVLGLLDRALLDMDALVARGINFADLYFDRGRALHGLGRSDEGLRSLEQAISINPQLKKAYLFWSTIEEEKGYPEKAVEILEKFPKSTEGAEDPEIQARIETLREKKDVE